MASTIAVGVLPLLPSGFGDGHGQGGVCPPGKRTCAVMVVVSRCSGDVGEQQPGDAFAFPRRGGRGRSRSPGRSVTSWPMRARWASVRCPGVLFAGLVVGVVERR